MKHHLRIEERGQSLVLVALCAVVLVGMVGLSVDGGNAYNQRRIAQNAADAAAMGGTYEVYQQHKSVYSGTWDEGVTRAKINTAAEAIGIADTNGIPGDAINDNIEAFFTDVNGTVIRNSAGEPCIVNGGNCSAQGRGKWGVHVVTTQRFTAYFAGIIGWNELTVRAGAVSVTHRGAEVNDEQFALFGEYTNTSCVSTYPVSISGTSTNITGNVHSNTSVYANSSQTTISQGALTYITSAYCGGPCPGQPVEQLPRPIDNFVYPDFNRYRDIINARSQTPAGTYLNGSVTVASGTQQSFGMVAKPFTFINGDFTIENGATSVLYGAIFVNGNVTIHPDLVTVLEGPPPSGGTSQCGGTQGIRRRLSLFAAGAITIEPGVLHLDSAPYVVNTVPTEFKQNVVTFFSNEVATSCSPSISISSSQTYFRGAILAPKGQISLLGNNNVTVGAIVGNTIEVPGGSNTIEYRPECSPPQPDMIELIR